MVNLLILKGIKRCSPIGKFQPLSKKIDMAWQGGVNAYGLGDTFVAYIRGDWTGISNVEFGLEPKSISINAGSKSGCTIRISVDSTTGPVIGYVTIPSTGDNWTFTSYCWNFRS